MPHSATRIAIVYQTASAYTRRLTVGITRFANPTEGYIAREFVAGQELLQLPAEFHAWSPDGVICFLDADEEPLFESFGEGGRPVVNLSRDTPQRLRGVVNSDAEGQYKAVHKHFREIGRDYVVQFVNGESSGCRATGELYCEFTKARRVAHYAFSHPGFSDEADLYFPERMTTVPPRIAEWLLALPKPTGVFTQQFFAGRFLCKSCQLLGIDVPDDVAIIGNDGFDLALACNPPLTTLRLPAEAIGYEAGKLVTEMLNGTPAPVKPILVSGVELMVRGSTAIQRPSGCDVGQAITFIEKHACEGISVAEVMSHTQGVSLNTFNKRFFEEARMKPVEMIRNRKLAEARRLLADSLVSITSIAGICGYCDDLYFRKVFKATEGVTPLEYRKLQHG